MNGCIATKNQQVFIALIMKNAKIYFSVSVDGINNPERKKNIVQKIKLYKLINLYFIRNRSAI